MTKEQENEVIDFMEGKDLTQVLSVLLHGLDVSEIINLVILSGRGYSVKLLKFFKWYCQLISDATLNRKVASGELPNGECKKRGHTRYWKKWDILHYIKSKRGQK